MIIKLRHRKTAEDFKKWLVHHPEATHGEIFKEFDNIADRCYREDRRLARERRTRSNQLRRV